MLSSLLATIFSTLATLGFGLALLRLFQNKIVPPTLKLGLALVIGAVVVGQALQMLAWVGTTLWISSVLIVAIGSALLFLESNKYLRIKAARSSRLQGLRSPPNNFESKAIDHIALFFLLLISIHFFLALATNVAQPFFPWDAFTTWIYRSKLWVLNDQVLSLVGATDWFDSGGKSGYALHASAYPKTTSLYSAFVASLSGRWNPVIAALPWSLIFIAMCLSAHGIYKLSGANNRQAVIGTYLLCSLPLVNIHAALAGYADLWIAALSGNGLCLLVIWRLKRIPESLSLGLILLVAGTQIKDEGWIWLLMGLTFILFSNLRIKSLAFGAASIFLITVFAWHFDTLKVSLGAFGVWGLSSDILYFGHLGQYPVRLYNPLADYIHVIVDQSNFHLAGLGATLSAFILVGLWGRRGLAIFPLLALIFLANVIIFGVSSYSIYAQLGTAITRILLQFSPLAILLIVLGWQAIDEILQKKQSTDSWPGKTRDAIDNIKKEKPLILILFAATFVYLIVLVIPGAFSSQKPLVFTSAELLPIVGESRETKNGRVFTDSSINVGVLKAPLQELASPAARYLRTNITMGESGGTSFYWIPASSNQVQSIPIDVSGPFLADLYEYTDWKDQRILEFGFLVDKESFSNIFIHELALQSGPSSQWLSALLNVWTSPDPLSQRLINNNRGHYPAPISLSMWLHIACVSLISLYIVAKFLNIKNLGVWGLVCGLLFFWIISDALFLLNSSAVLFPPNNRPNNSIIGPDPTGHGLLKLESDIKEMGSPDSPILVVSLGNDAEFAAQKLPYLLLPRRALFVREGWLESVPLQWDGFIVLLGRNAEKIDKAVARLTEQFSLKSSAVYDGCVVLEIVHKQNPVDKR